MKRIISTATGIVALLFAGIATAEALGQLKTFIDDDSWIFVEGQYRAIHQRLDCTYDEWVYSVSDTGMRRMTRHKTCKGLELMNIGKVNQ